MADENEKLIQTLNELLRRWEYAEGCSTPDRARVWRLAIEQLKEVLK